MLPICSTQVLIECHQPLIIKISRLGNMLIQGAYALLLRIISGILN